ncbi:ZCHC3 protein, partial [Atractosteus spatula]|nr:ZCHC3 protein [Atractosteus spatula]
MRNSVRFVLRKLEVGKVFLDRAIFEQRIMAGIFGLTVKDVLCLQDFVGSGTMDLTLISESVCRKVWEKVLACKDSEPLNLFFIEPLFERELKPLYVHVYNPFIPEEEIAFLLKRFVDIQGAGQKILDPGGYWTCKRRYLVRFRACAASEGGVVHPPPNFYIGSNRGYLYYSGQPTGCRKCGKQGHFAAKCTSVICRRCGVEGHAAIDCTVSISCNLCGGSDHLYNKCPKRVRSYAEAAASGTTTSLAAHLSNLEKALETVAASGDEGPSGVRTATVSRGSTETVLGPEDSEESTSMVTEFSVVSEEGQSDVSLLGGQSAVSGEVKRKMEEDSDVRARRKAKGRRQSVRGVSGKKGVVQGGGDRAGWEFGGLSTEQWVKINEWKTERKLRVFNEHEVPDWRSRFDKSKFKRMRIFEFPSGECLDLRYEGDMFLWETKRLEDKYKDLQIEYMFKDRFVTGIRMLGQSLGECERCEKDFDEAFGYESDG